MFETLPQTDNDFYSAILTNSLAAIKINRYTDNFDSYRFNFDGIDRQFVFNVVDHAFYFDWFFRNYKALFAAYSNLNDERSRRLFLHLIAFRLGGHLSVKLPVSFSDKSADYEQYRKSVKSTPSELSVSGMFGKLNHFDFSYRGRRYLVDCVRLDSYLFRGQYFYSSNGVEIAPKSGDILIDGGACTGDTAAIFSEVVGPRGKVYSFDPVSVHLEILEYNARQFPTKNVVVMPYGLSDTNIDAAPIVLNGYTPGFSAKGQKVPLRTIDHLVDTSAIERIDFIKLDVEGSELAAIRGARKSIEKFRPQLAISLYHKPNDLFDIVLYIRENFPFYSLHIDHYTIHSEETVLYCTT